MKGILLRTTIRDRLYTKFKDEILFTKVNNRQDVFISWNNLSSITHSTLINLSTLEHDYGSQSNNIYRAQDDALDKETQSKILFQAAELLQESIR
jgi:hypothetical protein